MKYELDDNVMWQKIDVLKNRASEAVKTATRPIIKSKKYQKMEKDSVRLEKTIQVLEAKREAISVKQTLMIRKTWLSTYKAYDKTIRSFKREWQFINEHFQGKQRNNKLLELLERHKLK